MSKGNEQENKQVMTVDDGATVPGFSNKHSFELLMRGAKVLANSTLVPKQYQGDMPNCIIALNMAGRMGADPLMVMQNLYIVHGNPSFSSQFLISAFNTSGRFSALRYQWIGKEGTDEFGCRAWAIEKSTGEKLEGSAITIAMAKTEGWFGKNGSKWKTMPQQMLMYRAAAFFIRAYAPELTMGMHTMEEIQDIGKPSEYSIEEVAEQHANSLELDIKVDAKEQSDIDQEEVAQEESKQETIEEPEF